MKDIDKQYFNQLLKKYRKGTATKEEIGFLESFYNMFDVNDELITDDNEHAYQQLKDSLKRNIDEQIDRGEKSPTFKLRRIVFPYAAAAAILVFASIGVYLLVKPHRQTDTATLARNIKPGGNRATLTLANGKQIDLTKAGNGVIAQQANISIHKNANNMLVYTVGANNQAVDAAGNIQKNIISTPKGGQYQVVLPDGTNVTLNAASSLTYPVTFAGHERVVELNGEAYFEVSKNKAMPFKVKSGIQTVTVLGTHFNVDAYYDESSIKTTLLEGSVEVTAGENKELITPGQQVVAQQPGTLYKRTANTDKEVAWKNGVFSFDGDDVKTIMRQVSRWYDVNVVYSGDFPNEKFYGEIARTSSLADVLKIMEINNIHFDISGRSITVSYLPKTTQK